MNLHPSLIWFILGAFLIIIEIFAPGTFVLWFGIAALVTAGLAFIIPQNLALQIAFMAITSIVAVLMGRKFYKKLGDTSDSSEEPLNERTARYIGHITVIESDIINGRGRIKIEDSSWLCESSEDLPKGHKVEVIGANGTVLIVKSISS